MFRLVVRCLKTAIKFLSYVSCKKWMNFPETCLWLHTFQTLILLHYLTLPVCARIAAQPLALHICVRRAEENAQWAAEDFLEAPPQGG